MLISLASFGVKLRSRNLGVVYNNQMDDFSSPGVVNYFGLKPAPVNFIQPGKRPQSSSSPVIILDRHGDVDVVIGASGGTFITTALAEVCRVPRWTIFVAIISSWVMLFVEL